uniref:Uncharacterized protein n=1 Tax=Anolis carolinensis TaxID=28377 RepID=G1KU82_ANOCA
MNPLEAGVLLLLCLLFPLLFSSFKMYKKIVQLPPGPTPWLFLGNLLQKNVLPLRTFYPKLVEKYGPIFTVWMGPNPAVVLCGYEVVKDALVNHAEAFGGRHITPILDRVYNAQGMMTKDDAKWRELRRFTLSTLRDFGMGKKSMSERIQEEACCLVKDITAGETFDVSQSFTNASSNVIYSVIFGRRFDYQDEMIKRNLRIAKQVISLSVSYTGMLFLCFPQMMDYLPGPHEKVFADCKELQAHFREVIKSHELTLDPENPRDYIDCFLIKLEKEKNSPGTLYSKEDLVMCVLELFLAGTTTVSRTLHFAIFMMARFPDIQAKVQEEINEVIQNNHVPGMEDRMRMPFTNAVIHEIQRYLKTRTDNFPHSTTCCVEFRGFTIPKGTAFIPNFISANFDPLHWETPEEFNPAHFLDNKGQFRKNNAFMTFSAGKRSCLGEVLARMELFLFFSTLLQNLCFQLVEEVPDMDPLSFFDKYTEKGQSLPIRVIKRQL